MHVLRASLSPNFRKGLPTDLRGFVRRLFHPVIGKASHRGAALETRPSQPFTSFSAFHSLLLKFLPCSSAASSNSRSLPAGEEIMIPNRTASAPYFSINPSNSGELPNCLLILRPCLSLTIPVKYTSRKGIRSPIGRVSGK